MPEIIIYKSAREYISIINFEFWTLNIWLKNLTTEQIEILKDYISTQWIYWKINIKSHISWNVIRLYSLKNLKEIIKYLNDNY